MVSIALVDRTAQKIIKNKKGEEEEKSSYSCLGGRFRISWKEYLEGVREVSEEYVSA